MVLNTIHRGLFWRGIPALMLIISGVLVAFSSPGAIAQVEPVPHLESETFETVNRIRTGSGLAPLVMDERLNVAARAHSLDMADRRYMSHMNPDGYSIADRARLAGVFKARHIAENLARHLGMTDPVADITSGWMNSPGHRATILDGNYSVTGLGVACAPDGTLYFTQLFADRS